MWVLYSLREPSCQPARERWRVGGEFYFFLTHTWTHAHTLLATSLASLWSAIIEWKVSEALLSPLWQCPDDALSCERERERVCACGCTCTSVCAELLSFRRTRTQMMVPERSLVEDRESSEGERDVWKRENLKSNREKESLTMVMVVTKSGFDFTVRYLPGYWEIPS